MHCLKSYHPVTGIALSFGQKSKASTNETQLSSDQSPGRLWCIGGSVYYPVIFRDYFINHEINVGLGRESPPTSPEKFRFGNYTTVAIFPDMHQKSGTMVGNSPFHFGRLFLGGFTWRPEVQTGVQLLEVLSNEDGVRFVRLSQRLGFIRGGLCGVIITPS